MNSSDVAFIDTVLAQIGSWAEQPVTVFNFTSVGTSGTTAEAGDPQTVTFGTRAAYARVEHVDLKDVERSSGRYQQDDMRFSIRGTFTNADMIAHDSGTYSPIDGPWRFFMGSALFHQCIGRKVQS